MPRGATGITWDPGRPIARLGLVMHNQPQSQHVWELGWRFPSLPNPLVHLHSPLPQCPLLARVCQLREANFPLKEGKESDKAKRSLMSLSLMLKWGLADQSRVS